MKHRYEQMVIEGTRLLGIKDDKRSGSYGSYVRIVDTGETCYACANGRFFDHEETQKMVDAVARKMLKGHHQTDGFPWKPINFSLKEDGSVQLIRRAETAADYFATFDCFPEYSSLAEKQ